MTTNPDTSLNIITDRKIYIFYPSDMWFDYIRPHVTNLVNNLKNSNSDNTTKINYIMYDSKQTYLINEFDPKLFSNDSKKLNLRSVIDYLKNNICKLTSEIDIHIYTPGYSSDYEKFLPNDFIQNNCNLTYNIIRDNRIISYFDHTSEWECYAEVNNNFKINLF